MSLIKRVLRGIGQLLLALLGLLLFWCVPAEVSTSLPPEHLGRNYGQLARIGIGLTVAVGTCAALLWLGLLAEPSWQLARGSHLPTLEGGLLQSLPRLSAEEAEALEAHEAAQRERLHSYGWVDEAAGVLHIPIDQAMEQWLEQGGAR